MLQYFETDILHKMNYDVTIFLLVKEIKNTNAMVETKSRLDKDQNNMRQVKTKKSNYSFISECLIFTILQSFYQCE